MIEVNGLVKRFDGFAALDGAALSVPAGSVYGLVGPNGAGKTTVMKLILNLAKIMNLFESVFVLQNDAVIQKADVLQTYIYTQTFNSGALPDFGYTTAVSVTASVVGCILVLLCNRASYKVRGRGIV